jgi:outer membrane lipoprotein carrier protein
VTKALLIIVILILASLPFEGHADGQSSSKVNQPSETDVGSKSNEQQDARKLAEILSNTLTYSADFVQSVYRETSDQAEVTHGKFVIQRPNHFRWETKTPFEQVIIADGDHLWTHDPELEQVTIQNQQAVLADSPLLLLTSSVESLVEAFEIKEVPKQASNQLLFSLSPKQNSLFESVHILIEDQKIKEFFLVDTLGGRSGVVFKDVELNNKIDSSNFIFVPPEGVDIIDSRETIN